MSNTDPVKIIATSINADNAAYDAEQDITLEISTVEIERAMNEAIAARQQEMHP